MRRLLALLFLSTAFLSAATPEPPRKGIAERVVSMSPHYTSIVYDLGAQDALVGVTDFCRTPPPARLKPRVGGFLDPNIERIVQLRPDLVLMLESHGAKVGMLRKLGLRVLVMGNDRLSDVYGAYDALGAALGRPRQAAAAKARLKARLKAVERASPRNGVSVLFIVGKDAGRMSNLYAAGPHTFPDEVMRLAGLRNVVEDSRVRYPVISRETVLKRDPDLVIQMPPEGVRAQDLAAREMGSWRTWRDLRAVREGRVFLVPDPGMMVPGPNTADLAEWLLKVLAERRDSP
jgi:iron complex transport system substrate-binding protein